RPDLEPGARGHAGAGRRQPCPRLHPQVRALRAGAGGADRVTAGLRRALIGLGIAGFIAGAVPLVLGLSAPDINSPELTAVFGPLVGWSFIGTGLFAWYRRPDNRFGPLMTAVGFTWCVSGLIVERHPGVFIIGY